MKTLLLTLAVILAFVAAPAVHAEDPSADVKELASSILSLMRKKGVNVRDNYTYGTLYRGNSTKIVTTLHAGNDYQIAVATVYKSDDVDVAVFDENGNKVADDTDETGFAVAKFRPLWTGKFTIKITMADCNKVAAEWVMQYGFTSRDD